MLEERPCLIFDGHNDTILQLYRSREDQNRSFFARSQHGHIDLPRAQLGGFSGGFFSIFVPQKPDTAKSPTETLIVQAESGYEIPPFPSIGQAYALKTALDMMALLFELESESCGKLRVVHQVSEIEQCFNGDALAAILHLEGAEAIGSELSELEKLYNLGLRSLGLVWSRENIFGHGVPFQFPGSPDIGPGLTDAGRRLVRACNRLGVLVDLAHLNERGFWDVAKLSSAPLVVTHAAAHALCPSTRNLTNKQLDAIASSGGVVGVSFNVRDLRADGKTEVETPLIEIARHINYMVRLIGIDHVALGSDFDGCIISNELKDVSGLPKLLAAISEAPYDPEELRKLTHRNWLRVLNQTWRGSVAEAG